MALGLIASGFAGGVGNALAGQAQADMDKQRRVDMAKEVGDMDLARQQTLAQFQQGLSLDTAQKTTDMQYNERVKESDPKGPLASNQMALDAARNQALLDFQTANAGQVGRNTATQETAKTNVPGYLESVRKETQAKETDATRAQAGLASAEAQKVMIGVNAMKAYQAAALKFGSDSPEASEAYNVMLGSSGQGRSARDVVAAAQEAGKLADDLQKQMNDPTTFLSMKPDDVAARKADYQKRIDDARALQQAYLTSPALQRRAATKLPEPGKGGPGKDAPSLAAIFGDPTTPKGDNGAPAPSPRPTGRPAPTAALPESITGGGGGSARRSAATDKLPQLQAALDGAKAQLQAAQSRGPLAMQQARDAWNNARNALADAKASAGQD